MKMNSSVENIILNWPGNIPPYYDLTENQTKEIFRLSGGDIVGAIFTAFRFGFIMGEKAERNPKTRGGLQQIRPQDIENAIVNIMANR